MTSSLSKVCGAKCFCTDCVKKNGDIIERLPSNFVLDIFRKLDDTSLINACEANPTWKSIITKDDDLFIRYQMHKAFLNVRCKTEIYVDEMFNLISRYNIDWTKKIRKLGIKFSIIKKAKGPVRLKRENYVNLRLSRPKKCRFCCFCDLCLDNTRTLLEQAPLEEVIRRLRSLNDATLYNLFTTDRVFQVVIEDDKELKERVSFYHCVKYQEDQFVHTVWLMRSISKKMMDKRRYYSSVIERTLKFRRPFGYSFKCPNRSGRRFWSSWAKRLNELVEIMRWSKE